MKYRAPRFPTRYSVTVLAKGLRKRAIVASVSTSGACIMCENGLKVGDEVTLEHAKGRSRGKVSWAAPSKAGIAFTVPLSSKELAMMRDVVAGAHRLPHHMTGFSELR